MCPRTEFTEAVSAFLKENTAAARLLGIGEKKFDDFAGLIGALLHAVSGLDAALVKKVYDDTPDLADMSLYDINETARRNFEPGASVATLLFSRGVQAILAHRVAHALWQNGDHMIALAVKSTAGRAFSTDIHPAANIGAGLWLDHGLGFVVGETCVIGKDVSIWHNVTLGSTLNDSGPQRHPTIGHGVVIGAGAIILGNITIGDHANVAAGAIVVEDVPVQTLVVGSKSRAIGAAQISFLPKKETDQ